MRARARVCVCVCMLRGINYKALILSQTGQQFGLECLVL